MAIEIPNAESLTGIKIPPTMRAAVYRAVNDVRLETVPVPEIGPGELLVKIATCGICGTDLKKIHMGSHSAPRIFGHEMGGTVVAVGKGVTEFTYPAVPATTATKRFPRSARCTSVPARLPA